MKKILRVIFELPKTVGAVFLDMLFPKHCIMCGKTMPVLEKFCLCEKCRIKAKNLPLTVIDNSTGCDEINASLPYDGKIRDAMLKFKFGGIKYLGYTFAKAIYNDVSRRNFVRECDLVIAVPIHVSRDRDYNQSQVIAEYFSRWTGIETRTDIVYKIKPINRLSSMRLSDKRFSIRDAFMFNGAVNLSGKSIIVIDDIYTSGTTMKEFSDELRKHGANKVYWLAACYSGKRER